MVALALPALTVPAPAEALTARQIYARSAINATNHVRSNHGLHLLKRSDCLARFAWAQARRMANRHSMFHQDLGPILRTCHLRMAGENVAFGYPTGRATVDAWMRSAPHRANILTPGYRQIGLGAVRGSDGLWYVSQVFGRHL
jgi:uncharacterized protein YkwD